MFLVCKQCDLLFEMGSEDYKNLRDNLLICKECTFINKMLRRYNKKQIRKKLEMSQLGSTIIQIKYKISRESALEFKKRLRDECFKEMQVNPKFMSLQERLHYL